MSSLQDLNDFIPPHRGEDQLKAFAQVWHLSTTNQQREDQKKKKSSLLQSCGFRQNLSAAYGYSFTQR